MFKNVYKIAIIINLFPLILMISGCAGLEEYKKSQTFLTKGEHQKALEHIELAIAKSPKNKDYLKLKQEISYLKDFKNLELEYQQIPEENLDKRIEKLKEEIEIAKKISSLDSTKYTPKRLYDALETLQSQKHKREKKIIILSQNIKNNFENSKYYEALKDLSELLPYKNWEKNVSEISSSSIRYLPKVDTYLAEEFKRKNFLNLKDILDLIDYVFEGNNITQKYRTNISNFYLEKGNLSLKRGMISTAILYYSLAKKNQNSSIDGSFFKKLHERLKDYNEKLYIEIKGCMDENKRESLKTRIFDDINKSCDFLFFNTQSFKDSTLAILISFDRVENDIDISNPQIKYSKFISGYNRVLNQNYYEAKADAEQAQLELYKLSLEPPPIDEYVAIMRGILEGVLEKNLRESISIMNSDNAYDKIPIYIDYTYKQTDVSIKNKIEVSYKIFDLKRRVLLKEDKISDKLEKMEYILEGVHPDDIDKIKNSDKFNFENQRIEFEKIINDTEQKLADTLSYEIASIFEKRGKDYFEIGEISESIDSYLLGYFVKNPEWINNIEELPFSNIFPNEFVYNFDDLLPETNLIKKLAARSYPEVRWKTEIEKTQLQMTKKKVSTGTIYSEKEIPKLIEESKNKVVLIKAIKKEGISKGSGFFISADGHIATNYHVVKDSNTIIVTTSDGNEFATNIEMSDSSTDLALLKIQIKKAPFFVLGSFDNVVVGEIVIAIGAPHGYEQTVSKGIVSGKRKKSLGHTDKELRQIQTDALMTYGNSGGPLINLNGEVIGVNTWTENVEGSPGALNFAISVDEITKRFLF